jgi:hypothetical protein
MSVSWARRMCIRDRRWAAQARVAVPAMAVPLAAMAVPLAALIVVVLV